MSLLSNPRVNTSKGKESSIQFLLHTLSKKLGNSKTLLSSLPLIFSGPAARKGRSFHTRVILCLFPLKNHKLGKGFNYSHLRIHNFFMESLVLVFVVGEIRKLVRSIYIYIYSVLRSFGIVLMVVEGRLGILLINDFI